MTEHERRPAAGSSNADGWPQDRNPETLPAVAPGTDMADKAARTPLREEDRYLTPLKETECQRGVIRHKDAHFQCMDELPQRPAKLEFSGGEFTGLGICKMGAAGDPSPSTRSQLEALDQKVDTI